jgi:hypothetical protein
MEAQNEAADGRCGGADKGLLKGKRRGRGGDGGCLKKTGGG